MEVGHSEQKMNELKGRHRAGRYEPQATGYRAFIPAPLPPDPPITIDNEMQTLLSRADRALGRLDGSIQTLPNPDLFILMYMRKEAVLSSQIEGTQASLTDLLEAEAKVLRSEHPGDVEEVANYVAAMNLGLERLQELPLSIRLIREIHERLLRGTRGEMRQPGEIRRTQNWIGPEGCTLSDATFVPPPPQAVIGALGDLEVFLHRNRSLPTLIEVGLAHAQFETIHPFFDGNGRVGRLLITFVLCEREVLIRPVLYLSSYFKEHRQHYYDLLQATRDRGDWEAWLKFFLTGVAQVSNNATEMARRIVDLREAHRALCLAELGRVAGGGLAVLETLFEQPIIDVNSVARLIDVSYPNANTLVQKLVGLGLLTEITGQARNRRYLYRPYIQLFVDL